MIEYLVNKYPDAMWDWEYLVTRLPIKKFQNILMQKVKKDQYYKYLSGNRYITIHIVLENLDKPWNWSKLSKLIHINDILKHSKCSWDWAYVCGNPSITIQHVMEHPKKPWNYKRLAFNKGITFQDILNLKKEWYFEKFSRQEKTWNLYYVSMNPNITLQNILDHKNLEWDWYYLSRNKNITFQNILEHPELPWCWLGVSSNNNITTKNVLDYPEKPWDFQRLGNNSNVSIVTLINKYKYIRYRFEEIYRFAPMQDILDYNLYKNWHILSCNPNLTLDFIEDHLDKIDFSNLSRNPFKRLKRYKNNLDILRLPKHLVEYILLKVFS